MSETKQQYPVLEYMNQKAFELLKQYEQVHSKILAVRLDIRYPSEYGETNGNEDIVKCVAKVKQTFARKGLDPAYMWVREQKDSTHPHFHCMFLLDGQKTQSAGMVYDITERNWQRTIGSSAKGLIDHCKGTKEKPHENGHVYTRSGGRPEYVNRQINYISKPDDKGERKDGLRDFGMSRCPAPKR